LIDFKFKCDNSTVLLDKKFAMILQQLMVPNGTNLAFSAIRWFSMATISSCSWRTLSRAGL